MADDDKQDDGFDPWAELESTPSPDLEGAGDFGLDGDSQSDAAAVPPAPDLPAEIEAVAGFAGDAGEGFAAADEDVADWLTEVAGDDVAPAPLGVFAGDDEPASPDGIDPEAVRVGLGESGIIDDETTEAHEPETFAASTDAGGFGWDEIEVESTVEPAAFGVVGSEIDEHAGEGFDIEAMTGNDEPDADLADAGAAALAAAAAGAATGAAIDAKPVKRQRAKKGGLGQMIGIVMGGLLALPITFAILIWGFRKDPLHLVQHVPESLAVLFPQDLVPGAVRRGSDGVAGGPTLDDVPAVVDVQAEPSILDEPTAEPVVDPVLEPVAAAEPAPAESSSEPPMATADASIADLPPLGTPASEVMGVDPAAVAVAAAAAPVDVLAPSADPFGDLSPVMPVPSEPLAPAEPQAPSGPQAIAEPQEATPPALPEPEPLDLSAVESAVAAAGEAYEAVQTADLDVDPDPARQTRRRNRLLVDWYRQVSLVAEELSALERVAADTGRPLESPPEAVTRLQDAVVGDQTRLDELTKLSRDWLAYKGRSTSGIVMPAVLAGVRHVGPYWCSTVTVAESGDRTRDLVVISRSEPAAARGDAVLVTGLIVDGDTLWASDVRPAVAGATTTIDPFAAPAP